MRYDKFWNYIKNPVHLVEVVIILAVLTSGFVLFSYERKQNSPDYQKSWVAFHFVDPDSPQKGITLENHLGVDTPFTFCLVPDSNDLMEPTDLSCSLATVAEAVTKNITTGDSTTWAYLMPQEKGKFWVVVEYKDDDVLKHKDLSFEIL